MSPNTISGDLLFEVPVLSADETLAEAVPKVVEAKVPALPVTRADGRLVGIFGERELITAIFPGYLGELHYAAFVTGGAQSHLELRECGPEPVSQHMNTDHIDVGPDYSDAQIAEIFLHHRVLIVPVVDEDRVTGIVTRADFFRALAARVGS